jgi:hypothetical protein
MDRHSNHNCHIRITPRGVMMSLASAAPLSLSTPRTPANIVQIFFLSFLLIIPPFSSTTLYSSNQINMSAKVYVGASPNDRSSL